MEKYTHILTGIREPRPAAITWFNIKIWQYVQS